MTGYFGYHTILNIHPSCNMYLYSISFFFFSFVKTVKEAQNPGPQRAVSLWCDSYARTLPLGTERPRSVTRLAQPASRRAGTRLRLLQSSLTAIYSFLGLKNILSYGYTVTVYPFVHRWAIALFLLFGC